MFPMSPLMSGVAATTVVATVLVSATTVSACLLFFSFFAFPLSLQWKNNERDENGASVFRVLKHPKR
uniref:Uncharacterized protein n=1 Tax=Gossypium raimondii TaxID=29730 RepID=A0A0D2M033_GOSRA|nr:hypothetical protein B456_001G179500 [Gossypium raimondii]